MNFRVKIVLVLATAAVGALGVTRLVASYRHMGKQPDGTYLVSSGQIVLPGTIAFKGRPSDIAKWPNGEIFAVTEKDQHNHTDYLFLVNPKGVIEGSELQMKHEPGFHGMVWSPDGTKLYVSTAGKTDEATSEKFDGVIETFDYRDGKLTAGPEVVIAEQGEPSNPVPGGLCLSKDGGKLYVPAGDLNAVLELDAFTGKRLRKMECNMIPFGAKLSENGTQLIVTNWGGRVPRAGDYASKTGISKIVVDKRGVASNGTVSIIDLSSGARKDLEVGIHPTDVIVRGSTAYIANSMSDSISEINLETQTVTRTLSLTWNGFKLFGSMPVALAVKNNSLYVCNGGDNALAEVDLTSGKVLGYRPAGYYPIAIELDGDTAWVVNSKGNGSVAKLAHGQLSGNAPPRPVQICESNLVKQA